MQLGRRLHHSLRPSLRQPYPRGTLGLVHIQQTDISDNHILYHRFDRRCNRCNLNFSTKTISILKAIVFCMLAIHSANPRFFLPGRQSDADNSASRTFDNSSFPMTTTSPVFVEFRCTRCWYSNCADSEYVGTEVDCRNCGERLEVPEATPDRIERALALLESEPELLAPRNNDRKQAIDFDRQYSAA